MWRTCRPGHRWPSAVCFLTELLAITSAMTNATITARLELAANHNQRGVRPLRRESARRGKSARWGWSLPVLRQLLGRTGLVGPVGHWVAFAGALLRPRRETYRRTCGMHERLVGRKLTGGRRSGETCGPVGPCPDRGGIKPGATWIVHVHLMACRAARAG